MTRFALRVSLIVVVIGALAIGGAIALGQMGITEGVTFPQLTDGILHITMLDVQRGIAVRRTIAQVVNMEFSPDGRWVLFERQDEAQEFPLGREYILYELNEGRTHPIELAPGMVYINWITWSGDSHNLYMQHIGQGGEGQFYRIDIATLAQHFVVEADAPRFNLSPFTSHFAISTMMDGAALYTPDGQQVRMLVDSLEAIYGDVYWSPDGRWVAYSDQVTDLPGQIDVFLVDLQTGDLTQVISSVESDAPGEYVVQGWSPDSRKLVILHAPLDISVVPPLEGAFPDYPPDQMLRVYDLDAGELQEPLLPLYRNSDTYFVWSPDSRFIMFIHGDMRDGFGAMTWIDVEHNLATSMGAATPDATMWRAGGGIVYWNILDMTPPILVRADGVTQLTQTYTYRWQETQDGRLMLYQLDPPPQERFGDAPLVLEFIDPRTFDSRIVRTGLMTNSLSLHDSVYWSEQEE